MSSNYPAGVSDNTFGAPFNDQEYEFSVVVDVIDNDIQCLGQFDNYHLEEDVDDHVKRYICYGGVSLAGRANYDSDQVKEAAQRSYANYGGEILWDTFELL